MKHLADTKLVIGRDGRKSILTTVMLGDAEGRQQLRIETSKMLRPGVETDAFVVRLSEHGFEHAFGLGDPLSGDFRLQLRREPGLRATEKILRTQHAAMLEEIDHIVAKARAHYVAQQARREAQQARDATHSRISMLNDVNLD